MLAVLTLHLPFGAAGQGIGGLYPAWAVPFTDYGRFGVHLFLVISGFCIHLQWLRRAGSAPVHVDFLAFWKRRWWRLYPPYAGALLLSLGALYLRFGWVGGASSGIAALGYDSPAGLVVDVVVLALLLQNLTAAPWRFGNVPLWTLALEEQLYALYFPLLSLRRRWGWPATLAIVAVVSLGWRFVGATALTAVPWWNAVGPSRWLEWALGALAAEAYCGRARLPTLCGSRWAALVLVAVAIGAHSSAAWDAFPLVVASIGDPLFGLAFFVLIVTACERERAAREHRSAEVPVGAVARLGRWSYSLYLTQAPVLPATKYAALAVGAGDGVVLALRAAVALAVGYVFHRAVERRFLR